MIVCNSDGNYSPSELSFGEQIRCREGKPKQKQEIGSSFLKKTVWTDREHVLYILFLENNR